MASFWVYSLKHNNWKLSTSCPNLLADEATAGKPKATEPIRASGPYNGLAGKSDSWPHMDRINICGHGHTGRGGEQAKPSSTPSLRQPDLPVNTTDAADSNSLARTNEPNTRAWARRMLFSGAFHLSTIDLCQKNRVKTMVRRVSSCEYPSCGADPDHGAPCLRPSPGPTSESEPRSSSPGTAASACVDYKDSSELSAFEQWGLCLSPRVLAPQLVGAYPGPTSAASSPNGEPKGLHDLEDVQQEDVDFAAAVSGNNDSTRICTLLRTTSIKENTLERTTSMQDSPSSSSRPGWMRMRSQIFRL